VNTPDAPDSTPEQGKAATPAGGGYLSPKLREKLEGGGGGGGGDDDDWKPKPQSPVPLIITLVVIAAVGGGMFFMMRAKAEAKHKADLKAHADSVAAAAAAEQAMIAARADSVRKAATAESLAVLNKKAEALAAAKAAGPFGIQAGSFLDEAKATSESAKISASTGLPAKVKPTGDGSFLVVVGSFETRAIAEAKGLELLGKGKVNQALVVSLKKK